MGNIVIEKKTQRWQTLLVLFFTALLVALFYWFIFGPGAANSDDPPSFVFKMVAVFVIAVGTFLFIYFLKLTIKPITYLQVNEEGFVMNHGISTQLIRWEEVQQMTYKTILVSQGSGTRSAKVVAVYLKDPQQFRKRFNKLLSGLIALNENLREASLYIPYEDLSGHHQQFEEIVKRKLSMPLLVEAE